MNDLISRAELLKKAIRVSEFDEGGWERVLRAVPVEDIEAAEAVDAVQVVRCKDCIFRGTSSCTRVESEWDDISEQWVHDDYTTDNGYCDEGQRRQIDGKENP